MLDFKAVQVIMFLIWKHLWIGIPLVYKIGQKIKTIRKQQGITLQQLSERVDLSKGYLSKIESSDSAPRLPTLQKIANALNVEMDVFFDSQEKPRKDSKNIDIMRGKSLGEQERFDSDSGYSFFSLLHSFKGKYMHPYVLKIPQGQTEQFTHDSEEFLYLVKGKIELYYDKYLYNLCAGDSVYLDSRIEHRIINRQKEEAEMVNVVFDYKRF